MFYYAMQLFELSTNIRFDLKIRYRVKTLCECSKFYFSPHAMYRGDILVSRIFRVVIGIIRDLFRRPIARNYFSRLFLRKYFSFINIVDSRNFSG